MLTSTSSQVRNISGYLSGLSSPSVTEHDHHARVLADAELGRADEVADVLDDQQVDLVERQRRDRRADHVRVEVALAAEAGVGVELDHGHVQAGEAIGVQRSLHVALEHADAHAGQARRRRARAASSCRRRARS